MNVTPFLQSYMDRYPQADVLVTSDQLASTIPAGDDGLEDPDKAQSPMNIGGRGGGGGGGGVMSPTPTKSHQGGERKGRGVRAKASLTWTSACA